jgi:hypothetical protein
MEVYKISFYIQNCLKIIYRNKIDNILCNIKLYPDITILVCVQTGSGAHPASCTMDTGGTFPGVKRCRGVTLTTHTI